MAMTIKNLQTRRDLLQNVFSQRTNVVADLVAIDSRIESVSAEMATLTADREKLATKLTACDQARLELPGIKKDLAAAVEAEEQRKKLAAKSASPKE